MFALIMSSPVLSEAMLLSELPDRRLSCCGVNVKYAYLGPLANQSLGKLQPKALRTSSNDGPAAFGVKIEIRHGFGNFLKHSLVHMLGCDALSYLVVSYMSLCTHDSLCTTSLAQVS